MCGIFAVFESSGLKNKDKKKYVESINAVQHRGPDNIDYFMDDFCFLGHSRLSIIDLESSSNQPFIDNNLCLIFNGEIFNYLELKEELKKVGHIFHTFSDTEVVIKSYKEWGRDCLKKFNGMWSFIIYDKIKKSLFVSRDRFGQKPLFIARSGESYIFASEIHQIQKYKKYDKNFYLIQKFLREGGYENNGETFFIGINEFPIANSLYLKADEKIFNKYWDYPSGKVKPTLPKTILSFKTLLEDAIKIRLRSDVGIGLTFSGGVDSTIIASIIDKMNLSKHVTSYTYESDDLENEEPYARSIANELNLKYKTCKQDINPREYIAKLRNLVFKLGRGHSSPAIVSIDYLYADAKKNKDKVVLDGQGADELLGGYRQYLIQLIFSQVFNLKIKKAFQSFLEIFNQWKKVGQNPLMVFIMFFRDNSSKRFKHLMRFIYGYEKFFKTYKRDPIPKLLFDVVKNDNKNENAVNRHLINQHRKGLVNLLYYGDIVAMNNSIENRSPFLDHRLVEFSFNHDEELKINEGVDKRALRDLEYYTRFKKQLERKKVGFSSNIRLKTKIQMQKALLNSPILSWPIFSKNIGKKLAMDEMLSMKYERILFRFFQVHLWNEIFYS